MVGAKMKAPCSPTPAPPERIARSFTSTFPRPAPMTLEKAIVEYEAAKATIEFKGTPTTPEGRKPAIRCQHRMGSAETTKEPDHPGRDQRAKVIQGGGQERFRAKLERRSNQPRRFHWTGFFPISRMRTTTVGTALSTGPKWRRRRPCKRLTGTTRPKKHPVCAAVLSEIGSGKKGKDVRVAFESTPYGWPRDAIDAALITLFTTGHIRATHKGVQLEQGQLDQAKISVTDFRVETITIDARARIKLRKLFQSAGIPCKPNEESIAAGQVSCHMTRSCRSYWRHTTNAGTSFNRPS